MTNSPDSRPVGSRSALIGVIVAAFVLLGGAVFAIVAVSVSATSR